MVKMIEDVKVEVERKKWSSTDSPADDEVAEFRSQLTTSGLAQSWVINAKIGPIEMPMSIASCSGDVTSLCHAPIWNEDGHQASRGTGLRRASNVHSLLPDHALILATGVFLVAFGVLGDLLFVYIGAYRIQ